MEKILRIHRKIVVLIISHDPINRQLQRSLLMLINIFQCKLIDGKFVCIQKFESLY